MRFMQVGARAVDGARELDLLGGQIALRIVAELLAQDEDAVQRRPELVRHIGEEFRLVLGGQRQFGGLFLQRAPRLLDLLVLALPPRRSARRAAGPSAPASHWSAAARVCWVCSSVASCCDCFSRPSVCIVASMLLSTMPMPAVSCSRKDELQGGELVERGELDDRLDLALEQRPAARRCCAARASNSPEPIGDGVRRHVGDQDAALSAAHWPIRPSPSPRRSGWPLLWSSA